MRRRPGSFSTASWKFRDRSKKCAPDMRSEDRHGRLRLKIKEWKKWLNRRRYRNRILISYLKVRREKLAELQANGKDPFQITKFDVTHHSTEIKEHFEELEGKTVTIAGRMMSKRVMGKSIFLQCC